MKKLEANLNKETQPTQGSGLDVQKDWFCQKAIFVILADVFQNLEWGFTLTSFNSLHQNGATRPNLHQSVHVMAINRTNLKSDNDFRVSCLALPLKNVIVWHR